MVTGDFKHTAASIARACNVLQTHPDAVDDYSSLDADSLKPFNDVKVGKKSKFKKLESTSLSGAIVLEGHELIKLNEAQWDQLATYREAVFARTTPEQKLRIV